MRKVGAGLGDDFFALRGSRRVEGGFAWTGWESDDPRDVQRARARVERSIPRGAVLLGFSQGAMLALEVAFAGRTPLRAVIAVGAYLAPGGLARPVARLHEGPPLLLLHGRDDDAVPVRDAEKALARLEPLSPRAELRVVKGGHEVTREMLTLARRFLRNANGPR